MSLRASRYLACLLSCLMILWSPLQAWATTYYWDVNGATAGFSTINGTWDGSNAFWNTISTGTGGSPTAIVGSGDDLNINGGTTGTITLSGTQAASSLTFNVNVVAAVSGGTSLTIGGTGASSGIFVTAADTVASSVTSPIILNAASSAITLSNLGTGTLTLGAITGAAASGTQTITVSGTGAITLSNVIADNPTPSNGIVALAITNTGTTTLSGANTFTGGVNFNSTGTLALGNATALGASPTSTLTIGAAGILNASVATVTTNAVAVNSDFRLGGAISLGLGALTLNGDHTITVNNTAGATMASIGGPVGTNLTLTATTAGIGTFTGGVLTGIGGTLTKTGLSTSSITLGGQSTYTGATTINGGTLKVDFGIASTPISNPINSGSTLVLGGGTLALAGLSSTVDSQAFNNTALSLGTASTITLTLNSATSVTATLGTLTRNAGATLNVNGVTTSITALIVNTTGLTNNNGILGPWATVGLGAGSQSATYATLSGITGDIISLGNGTGASVNLANVTNAAGNFNDTSGTTQTPTVNLTANTLRSAASAVKNTALTTNTLSVNGLLITGNGGGITYSATSGGIVIGADTSHHELVVEAETNTTISAPIANNADSAASALTLAGPGAMTLSGANTYSGVTTIASGSTVKIGAGGTSGTLGSGNVVNNGVLQFSRTDAVTVANNISGSGSITTIAGSGVLTITGNNTFTGGTTVAQTSTLQVGDGATTFGSLGTGTVTLANSASLLVLDAPSGSFNFLNLIAQGTSTGGVTVTGPGTVTFQASNTYAGKTTISGGATLVVTNLEGGSANSSIGSSPISAATNLTIDGGTLKWAGTTPILTGASSLRTFAIGPNGATLDASGSPGAPLRLKAQAATYTGSGSRTLTLTGANTTDVNSLGVIVNDNGADVISLTKSGIGTWSLIGANTYTGVTTLNGGILTGAFSNGGTGVTGTGTATPIGGNSTSAAGNLVFNGGTLTPTGANWTTDRLFTLGPNGGTIDAGTLITSAANGFTNPGSLVASSGNPTLTLNVNGASTNLLPFAPVIVDPAGGSTSLTKTGTGTVILTAASTYTGATNINVGTLKFPTSAATIANSSAINVAAAATLDATGYGGSSFNVGLTIPTTQTLGGSGAVTTGSGGLEIGNHGTLSPGGTGTVGTLTLGSASGNLFLTAGATSIFDLTTPGASDLVSLPGNAFAFQGNLTLQGSLGLTAGTPYALFTLAGGTPTIGTLGTITAPVGFTASNPTVVGNSVDITLTAIVGGTPKPTVSFTTANNLGALTGVSVPLAGNVNNLSANGASASFTGALADGGGNLPTSSFVPSGNFTIAVDGPQQGFTASIASGAVSGSKTYTVQASDGANTGTATQSLMVYDPAVLSGNFSLVTPVNTGNNLTLANAAGANRAAAQVVTVTYQSTGNSTSANGFSVTGGTLINGAVVTAGNSVSAPVAFTGTNVIAGTLYDVVNVAAQHNDQTIVGTSAGDLGIKSYLVSTTVAPHQQLPNTPESAYLYSGQTYTNLSTYDSATPGVLGHTATIRYINPTSSPTLTLTWNMSPSSFALNPPAVTYANQLGSDRLDVSGIAGQLYVLQMSYDPTKFAPSVADSAIELVYYNTTDAKWEAGVQGNAGGTAHFYDESYDTFLTNNGNPTGPALDSLLAANLGAYGTDSTTDQAWAIVNHNSEFAVVPEPSSLVLLAFGALAGFGLWRRKKRAGSVA